MNKIKKVLEGIYKRPELRKRIVPIFMGDPGLGKTFLINEFVQFARDNKVNFVDFFGTTDIDPKLTEYIGSQISPLEVSGIGMPDKDSKQMVYYNFNKLASLKPGDILFFDELPNSNPATLNSLLTLIEGRMMLSGDKLPDIMIVAAGNFQGMSPMTPQIKRRFMWYKVKFDSTMWKDYMFNKYKLPEGITQKLCNLIKNETFEGYNYNTAADLDKVVEMLIYDVPLPDEYSQITPILNELITNTLDSKTELAKGVFLEPNETIPWLKLKQYELGVINVENTIEEKNSASTSGLYKIIISNYHNSTVDPLQILKNITDRAFFNVEFIIDMALNQIKAFDVTFDVAEVYRQKLRRYDFNVQIVKQ